MNPAHRNSRGAARPSTKAPRANPRSGATRPVALAADSLAFALARAAELVVTVLEGGNLTDAFERMQATHLQWAEGTRGAVRDLAWRTLREYARGDAILDRLLQSAPPVQVRALLLVALSRLRQRPEQAHTVVDQAVTAAAESMPGLRSLVNGVLRNALRQQGQWQAWIDADPAARHAFPAWWVERLRVEQADAWAQALAAGNERPPMALRVNLRRTTLEDAQAALAEQGLVTRRLDHGALLLERALPVARLPGYAEGRLSVQDAGAQWAAQLLDAQAGERVLDACAAPGGKTAHILERAEVDLLALELDPVRAQRVERNLQRLGLRAHVRVADCRDLGAWWDGRPFDRILADVPCSASGVVRRHPDIKWLRRETDIAQFAAAQAAIVDALWRTLAQGGTMLYVTCSVFHEENAAQLAAFLLRHADAERLAIHGHPDLQLLPCAEHDGFYYALLRKRP